MKNKFGQLVAEVAHDLKSPVTALNLTIKKIQNNNSLDENILKELFLATKDITNISSSILSDYYQITDDESNNNKSIFKDDGNYPRFIVLPNLIEGLITRKQTEFGNNINLKLKCNKWFYTNLCQISPTKLIRNLSNIINNSVQSCKHDDCIIKLGIIKKSDTIEIVISDNGCGIPANKLHDIISIGDSSKHKGQGLGIISCKKYLDEINGKFKITSEVNVGTEVTLEIPLISNPEWFIQEVLFEKDQKFVVIDDDSQIILYWQNIFSKLGVPAFYCINSASFKEWLENNFDTPCIIFSDYDLKDGTNGYDLLTGLINKLGQAQLILATDHAEEEWLQKMVEQQNKIKLVPKDLLNNIRIQRSQFM